MKEALKRVAVVYTGTTPPTSEDKYYDSEDVDWYGPSDIKSDDIYVGDANKKIAECYFHEKGISLYQKGTVLMVGIGATVGKVGYVDRGCYSNQQINAIVFNSKKIKPKFGAYYLQNLSSEVNKKTPIVTLQIFNQSKVKQIELDYPSLEEQSRIVTYLDNKTASIDKKVTLLTEKRDAYLRLKKSIINRAVTKGLNPDVKMKDSGVEWIGEIPEGWTRLRLKDCGFLYGGLTGKAGDDFRCDDDSKTKPFIPFTNILNNDKIDISQFKRVVMSDGEEQNKVKKDDLLFLMSSEDYESIAKSSVVVDEPGEVYLNSFCRGFRIKQKDVYPQFVNYQLMALNYRDALRFEARGFTRINIKTDRINSMFVSLPSYEEQIAITENLDEKLANISTAVSNINTQIEKYKLLKRALINEVVTGKRAV